MLNEWAEFSNGKKMVDKRIVLVKFGNNSRGISFSSDGGNDREALEKEIREVYHKEIPEDTPFFAQIKDEEWLDTVTDENLLYDCFPKDQSN